MFFPFLFWFNNLNHFRMIFPKTREIEEPCGETVRNDKKSWDSRQNHESWQVWGYWHVTLVLIQNFPNIWQCLLQIHIFRLSSWVRWNRPVLAKISLFSLRTSLDRWQPIRWFFYFIVKIRQPHQTTVYSIFAIQKAVLRHNKRLANKRFLPVLVSNVTRVREI